MYIYFGARPLYKPPGMETLATNMALRNLKVTFRQDDLPFPLVSHTPPWQERWEIELRTTSAVRVQNKSPLDVPLWYVEYFELMATKTLQA